jgi:hypothetical protein
MDSSKRLEVCNTCDKLKIVFMTRTCGVCNCIVAAKVLLPNAACPLNKWEDTNGSKK